MEKAAQRADFVVASNFVNPLQFGPSEDLDKYPRTLLADQEKLVEAGCHLLFTPDVEEMYPSGTNGQTPRQRARCVRRPVRCQPSRVPGRGRHGGE